MFPRSRRVPPSALGGARERRLPCMVGAASCLRVLRNAQSVAFPKRLTMTSSISPELRETGASSSDGAGLHGAVPDLPPQVGRSFPEPDIWLRLRQVRQRPGHAVDTALALARGQYYKLKFRLLGRRFR